MSLRLALIDDHQLFRDGLRALIASQPDLDVVAEASTAREGCDLVAERRPDVVLMDLAMPGMNGIDATAEMRRGKAPGEQARVLVMSDRRDEDLAARAFAVGARGCVCKEQPAQALFDAIRRVGRGEEYRPPWLSMFALDQRRAELATARRVSGIATVTRLDAVQPAGPQALQPDPVRLLAPLTAREKEVFGLLVGGDDNDAVAKRLGLSVKTVETHRARIMKKLGVHTMAELVRLAARHGLL